MKKTINKILLILIICHIYILFQPAYGHEKISKDITKYSSEIEIEPTIELSNVKRMTKYKLLKGRDRIGTAVEVSKRTYPSGSDTVVLVNGFIYADSISSIPLASNLGGPILLTSGKCLESEVAAELNRLNTKKIVLVGGTNSISDNIVVELKKSKYDVTRIEGANRYITNQRVIEEVYNEKHFDRALFVSGENFADSISSGVYAYKHKIPIILVPSILDSDIKSYISSIDVDEPILVGGVRYLPKELDHEVVNSRRLCGLNRYDTSYIINSQLFSSNRNLVITTGEDFADALSGVTYAAKEEANLVLYDYNPKTYVNYDKYDSISCLGGRVCNKLGKNIIKKVSYSVDYVSSANNILENRITNLSTGEGYLKYKGHFYDYKNEGRGVRRHLYGFFYLNDLVNAFEKTGNRKYIDKGMELIKTFEEEQLKYEDEMLWHDETVARRLDYYLRFYSVANFMVSSSNKHILNTAMYRMASKMSYTDFWAGNYNHGLFQDMAVMRYANFSNNEQMFKLAESRAANYFDSYFDSEGVHSENSPEYHFVMLKELRDFMEDVSGGDDGIYGVIKNKYEKSKRFSDAIILPNKLLPVIGDTGKIEPVWEDFYATSRPEYTYNLTRNTFKHSGYDIAKSKNSYLLLRGAYLTNIHHHDDDLSFWLYKNGNIFTEVGAFGYEYSNPLTQYVRTFKAHNSLVVDSDVDYKGQGMDVQLIGGDKNNMGGISRRTKNSEFSRNINFDDNLTQVKITDNLHSTDGASHLYELYFHLDPSINISLENNIVILRRNGQEIGKFTSSGTIRLEKDIYCQDYSSGVQETNVLVVTERGVDVKIDTNISLN